MFARRRHLVKSLLLVTIACGQPDESPPVEEAIVPLEGRWDVTFPDTWGGDCQLGEAGTRMGGVDTWEIELETYGFRFYEPDGRPVDCTLTDSDFACSLGTDYVGWSNYGMDATERITRTLDGTFDDDSSFTGRWDVAVECEGADCSSVGTQYGDAFTYPCTAEMGLTGVWVQG